MRSTKKLKLQPIESENRQEGKYNLTFDPYLNLELTQYLDAYKAQFPEKKAPKPEDLITAIVRQHLANDSDFSRYKKTLKQAADAQPARSQT